MTSLPELRINGIYGPHGGYFRLKLSSENDAIKAAISLRHLGLGLSYRKGLHIETSTFKPYDIIIKTLEKNGLCRNAFFIPKGMDASMPPPTKR